MKIPELKKGIRQIFKDAGLNHGEPFVTCHWGKDKGKIVRWRKRSPETTSVNYDERMRQREDVINKASREIKNIDKITRKNVSVKDVFGWNWRVSVIEGKVDDAWRTRKAK